MRSSFFEFNVAITGLFTSKGALNTVSHNMANAATKGYSKQYAEIRASWPIALYNGKGMVGTGSEIYGVGQLRSFYLDKKYWSETPIQGEYSVKNTQLDMVERTFNELSGLGLAGAFDKFFTTLSDLSTTANDATYRVNTIQSASSLAKFINNTAESLKNQQADLNSEVKTMVEIINSLGQQIVTLNKQITNYELDGSRANDLRDERARLVDTLSSYVNVQVTEEEVNEDFKLGKYPDPEDRGKSEKRFSVSINGYEFVNHFGLNTLRVQERDIKVNPMDVGGLYDIYFNSTNTKFDIYHPYFQGQLRGLIDMRDGNNGNIGRANSIVYDPLIDPLKITAPLNPQYKTDFPTTGGRLVFIDKKGTRTEVDYTSYNPATGEFRFEQGTRLPWNLNDTTDVDFRIEVGVTDNYKGIPHYMNKLNELVRTVAKAFNDGDQRGGFMGHLNGYDISEAGKQGVLTNLLFFSNGVNNSVIRDGNGNFTIDYTAITADNFQINPLLVGRPELLAAAKDGTAGVSDNRITHEFAKIRQYTGLFKEGKLSDYVVGISLEIGIDAKQANNFKVNYKDVIETIDNQRKSVSGVDIDEEMIDMERFQQLFVASSKLINVINEIYDVLINQVGR